MMNHKQMKLLEAERNQRDICWCKAKQKPISHEGSVFDMVHRIESDHKEEKKARDPYLRWTKDELLSYVKQRKVTLPERYTITTLRKLLRDADKDRQFRLMDLPPELRLRIFEIALRVDQDREMHFSNPKRVGEPALLRTCTTIRQEATHLFYRNNTFILSQRARFATWVMESNEINFGYWESIWLEKVGNDNIANLRSICFQDLSYYSKRVPVIIDLQSESASGWTLYPSNHRINCNDAPRLSLTEEAKIARFSDNAEDAERMTRCIATATNANREFRELCGYGRSLRPTIEGLRILSRAVTEINHYMPLIRG